MRWLAALVLVPLALTSACTDRTLDYEKDFTEEIIRICEAVCEKADTCVDPPIVEYEKCMKGCTIPGGMHDDTVCGQAFRDFYDCVGSTATCEEYLDTQNFHAEDYTCKEEGEFLYELKCGAQDGSD
jgi:hypothetical protein